MKMRFGKCMMCGGEQAFNSSQDCVTECMFCGGIIDNEKAIKNYYQNGSHKKTEIELQEESKLIRKKFLIESINVNVSSDDSGYVSVIGSFTNKSSVPIVSVKIMYRLLDDNANELNGKNVGGTWYFDFKNNMLQKNQSYSFESQGVYLSGEDKNAKSAHILLINAVIVYDNDELLVVNTRPAMHIRDDALSMPKITFDNEIDEDFKPNANEEKSWMVYVFLGFVFSGWGVHNFYAGNKKRAIAQLLITLTIIGSPISGAWAIMESISVMNNKKVPDYNINNKLF